MSDRPFRLRAVPAQEPPAAAGRRPAPGVLAGARRAARGAALCLALAASASAAAAPVVQRFSPVGEVAVVRQARATFSEPMVPMGKPDAASPFDVACPAPGNARWVDARTWVYDFERPPVAGTECTFTVSPAARSVAGDPVGGTTRFQFSTGGPAIARALPSEGSRIDEEQAFLLVLTGPATPASVAAKAWCQAGGLAERVPVRTLPDADKALLVRRFRLRDEHVLALACTRRFAADADVALVWDAGIATPSGVATRQRQALKFKVRPRFEASLSCERENATAPCTPLGSVRIEFSAPVERKLAQGVRLKFAGGERAPERLDESESVTTTVSFKPPFPESTAFTVELPREFRDVDGRALSNASIFPLPSRTAAFPPLAKFATAPFGIVESMGAPPAMPLTLRYVEPELAVKALAPDRPSLRELRMQTDAQIIAWTGKLRQFHERTLGEDELRAATGQPVRKRAKNEPEPQVESRSVGLLAREAAATKLQLPAPGAAGAAKDARGWPFEVIGVPLPEPGYYVLELESAKLGEALLGRRASMYVRTSALVTNLSVHFKRAGEHAMAWVTTLDAGRPVDRARVQVSDCTGRPLWQGATDANGLARIDVPLPALPDECFERGGYFVSARAKDAKGRDDVSFVWSDWNQGIEPWRFALPNEPIGDSAARAHTVFDRTLLRAGETVSMKHLVRIAVAQGLARPPDASLPTKVAIVHVGTDQTYTFDLAWKNAAAETGFRIPPGAKLGRYEVFLDYGDEDDDDEAPARSRRPAAKPPGAPKPWWRGRRETGAFRVEAFRLPVFDARLVPPAGPAVAATKLALQAQVSFLSGGPARGLPMQVSAMLNVALPEFAGWDQFSFDREDLSRDDGDDDESDGAARAAKKGLHRDRLVADKLALTLDANGAGTVTLDALPSVSVPHRLATEATFADPNGEIQTIRSSTTIWPSANVVGIRTAGWVIAGRQLAAQLAVLDTAGKPREGAKVAVRAVLRKTLSTRKRLVGGFYAYENTTQLRELGEVCSGSTSAQGLVDCTIEPKLEPGEAGNLMLIAQSADAQGRVGSAATSVWLSGRGELWFDAESQDRMDVVPERKRYAPGETARLQVRMPFRYATAWVSIEREGIVESRIVQLDGRNPTIELPVQPNWGPNVYVSVLAVRGRLREVPWYSFFVWGWRAPAEWYREWKEYDKLAAPTPTVDLAKPAYKLGVAEIAVGIDGQRLKVEVVPDRQDYTVRGQARVALRVWLPDGKPAPAGTEIAFAAVDQALLELSPNASWNLLEAMMQRRSWSVETATAQMQVVGRRHFGRKAVPAGGDGGRNPTRELFDTLLAWQPRVLTDAQGRASVDVKLNDSLTRFRLVAVADSGPGYFGTGDATIRTTQDLQVISGLPLAVREGDAFNAMVTLRNTSAQPMKVQFEARAQVAAPGTGAATELAPLQQSVELAAGAATTLALPVRVPDRAGELRWTLQAKDATRGVTDRVAVRQAVAPAVPVTVRQATLAQLSAPLALPIAMPEDALAGRSQLRVALAPTIAGSLDGVRDWFLRYPYGCLEQRVSKSVGLDDRATWAALMEQLSSYVDADGLAQYFPVRAGESPAGSEVLTAYLLAIAHEAGLPIPDEARDALLRGLAAWVDGRVRRNAWSPRADAPARRLAALEALSRYGRATPAMVSSLAIEPSRLPASALLDWIGVLGRVDGVPQREQRLAQADAVLRARLTYTGTQLVFVQEDQDRWWWLMASADANAARTLLHATRDAGWKDDAPRVLGGLVGRLRRGAWDTTTANAWGTVAMRRFAARFESVPVDGTTRVVLDGGGAAAQERTQRWPVASASPAGAPIVLPLGDGESSLRVAHEGAGAPWAMVQALAAVPLAKAQFAGYRLARRVEAVQRKLPDAWSRGDVVRVRVTIDAAQPMTWVVVADPVPAGASVLGSGLGRDSAIAAADKAPREGWAPTFEERAPDAVRAYWEYLPAGTHQFAYTLRLNQDGDFGLPPTRAEAMYAPEVAGELPNARVKVQP